MIDVEEILEETGAMLHGHFLLPNGFHTDIQIQFAKAVQYTWHTKELASELALKLHRFAPDCIASPVTNGIIIGYEVARDLDVPFIFSEKSANGSMTFSRGLDPSIFRNIIIVEGVIEEGQSVRELLSTLKKFDSEAIAVSSVVKRTDVKKIDGLSLLSLTTIPMNLYKPEECPMCKAQMPLVDVERL